MGVSVRISRSTRVYLPFWLVIPFWLLVGPAVLAGYIIYWTAKGIIVMAQAFRDRPA
jgi:hypothetical protein